MAEPIVTNRKAFRDYFFTEKWECGLELKGSEIKSIRAGKVNFKDSFARIEKDELYLYNLHIEPYQQASYLNVESDRVRRLLLHKREVRKIDAEVTQKHLSLVPTKLYYNRRGFVKVEIAIGKGKKVFDKRETIKKRQIDRDLKRVVRNRNKR